eukprot:14186454-Ditylum_brightwellii.AAC.1
MEQKLDKFNLTAEEQAEKEYLLVEECVSWAANRRGGMVVMVVEVRMITQLQSNYYKQDMPNAWNYKLHTNS